MYINSTTLEYGFELDAPSSKIFSVIFPNTLKIDLIDIIIFCYDASKIDITYFFG